MSYLSKFGYDEVFFNTLLLQIINNDPLLEGEQDFKKALSELMIGGGKRIRPLFLLMAADLGNDTSKMDCYQLAVAMELLHFSSLIHDDIIDHASLRHNVLTLHTRYNESTALKLGNYILHKSLEIFSQYDDPRIHLQIANTMQQLCVGELKQRDDIFNLNMQIEDYLTKSHQKTGTLISASLVIGGILANLKDEELETLSNIGKSLGTAYQLKDDISDFVNHDTSVGKPVCNDLRQGIITLPTIFALENDLIREDLISFKQQKQSSIFDSIYQEILAGDYIQQSEAICQKYLQHTKLNINKFPSLKTKLSKLMDLLFN